MEEQQQKMLVYVFAAAVLAVALWWWFVYRKKKTDSPSKTTGGSEEPPTIYGSLGCPYTVKQMEKYPGHKFVDCTSGSCPEFVTAYPTTKFADGRIEVGFS
jgi:hypothetical protein